MINKKIQLEMDLQFIPPHPTPKVDLEQYSTPAGIAADLLWNAFALGDIRGLKVVDLGTGTGIFAIGAALLGAVEVVGVDADPQAVELARAEASKIGLEELTRFISVDLLDFHEKADTVIQNPPFGAQKAHRKEADRVFMSKSLEIAPVVYSFHMLETEEFVKKFFQSKGGSITHSFYYNFPIPRIYDFHKKENINVDVVVLRVEKV
jgi:putative methylase